MASVLEPITFDPAKFLLEMADFEALLKAKADLSERGDLLPFFKSHKHVVAYMGTFAPNIPLATEVCFEFDLSGDFKADLLLGSKQGGEFCIVELEDGCEDSLFKKKRKRKYPEWSPRFEHGFSQIVDWLYNLDCNKNTPGFADTFGHGHISFTGLLVMGRGGSLDESNKARLKWRTDNVSIGRHKVSCITFDDLHAGLLRKFNLYRAHSVMEKPTQMPNLPPAQP